MVAPVQQVGGDFCNGFGGAGDVQTHRVYVVDGPQEVKEGAPAGVVVVHPDFLADDALLLLHRLRGEVGAGDEIQEDFQGLPEIAGAAEEIGGAVEGGEGVGGGAGLGVLGEGVSVVALEHLVLQKVGDAGGDLHKILLPLGLKGGVDASHLGGEHGVSGGVSLHGTEEDGETAGMLHPQELLPQGGGGDGFFIHGFLPPFQAPPACWPGRRRYPG